VRKIKQVKAWGLWSHLESIFEFAPGLTVITGGNDCGKTSLFKIIRWVALGEPDGESFIFQLRDPKTKEVIKESKSGKAEIIYDDGIVITKERKRNGRTVYTHSSYADPFVQASVPLEVTETMGIVTSAFGDLSWDLNFSFQHDAPFLLSESPTAGAKMLGLLAGTEVVDLAISSFKSDRHTAQTAQTGATNELARIAQDLLQYASLDENLKLLGICKSLMENATQQKTRLDSCKGVSLKLEVLIPLLSELAEEVKALATVPELDERLTMTRIDFKRYDDMESLSSSHRLMVDSINSCINRLKALAPVTEIQEILQEVTFDFDRGTKLSALASQAASLCVQVTALFNCLHKYKTINQVDTDLLQTRGLVTIFTELTGLLKEYQRIFDTGLECQEVIDRLEVAETCAMWLDKVKIDKNSHSLLLRIFNDYSLTTALLDSINHKLRAFDIGGLDMALQDIKAIRDRLLSLMDLKSRYNVCVNNLDWVIKDLVSGYFEQAKKELEDAWREAGGVCPLCNSALSECNHTEV
jgi:exonuclease SbcC